MKRILFVDDEAAMLEALRRMLRPQAARWEMVFAGGGESALRMMESCPFDVVVTDMRMPGMDGAQFLERVRDRFPGVVRIVLSGYADMESALKAVPVAHQFLQKTCDPAILLQSIERGFDVAGSLQDKTIRRIVGAVGELPCLPRTAAALMRAVDDPDVPVTKVGLIVEQDVGISAKVLQLVNSAFFGRSQVVTNIPHAVTFLGVDVLKQLVVTAEIFRVFQPRGHIEGFSLESIQSHSHLVAAIASHLPLSKAATSTATIAALLHDAGKLVMASRLPLECERIRRLTIGGRLSFPAAEEQVLGASHAEIGACLLALWGLPAGIVSAVARHHSPCVQDGVQDGDQPAFDAAAAVYFANFLAHEVEPAAAGGPRGELPPDDQAFLQALGMEAEIVAWRAIAETAGER